MRKFAHPMPTKNPRGRTARAATLHALKLLRMLEGRLGDRPREHARDLAGALLPLHLLDVREHGAVARLLAGHVMRGRLCGHLREMGDDDDLVGFGELAQHVGQRKRRTSAHAGIDLVEDERRNVVALAHDGMERQHDARQLAA